MARGLNTEVPQSNFQSKQKHATSKMALGSIRERKSTPDTARAMNAPEREP